MKPSVLNWVSRLQCSVAQGPEIMKYLKIFLIPLLYKRNFTSSPFPELAGLNEIDVGPSNSYILVPLRSRPM